MVNPTLLHNTTPPRSAVSGFSTWDYDRILPLRPHNTMHITLRRGSISVRVPNIRMRTWDFLIEVFPYLKCLNFSSNLTNFIRNVTLVFSLFFFILYLHTNNNIRDAYKEKIWIIFEYKLELGSHYNYRKNIGQWKRTRLVRQYLPAARLNGSFGVNALAQIRCACCRFFATPPYTPTIRLYW